MNNDFFLRFASEADWNAVAASVTDVTVDVIGVTSTLPQFNEEGALVVLPVQRTGFLVNVRGVALPEILKPYEIEPPAMPLRIFFDVEGGEETP